MTKCHGCHHELEPLAAIRTYHGGCDPQGRVEYLERVLRRIAEGKLGSDFDKAIDGLDPERAINVIQEFARDALAEGRSPPQQQEG